MPLSRQSFSHHGLAQVHFGGSDPSIPTSVEGRCQRLTDSIESATQPSDLNIPGNGYNQSGPTHSVNVNGRYRITFEWTNGHGHNINFI